MNRQEVIAALAELTGLPEEEIGKARHVEIRVGVDMKVQWCITNIDGLVSWSDAPREIELNGKRYILWPTRLPMEAAAMMTKQFGLPVIHV